VSHGGIGTTALAIAAAVPHLVLSFAHDQLDNGSRLSELGIGDVLPARRARPVVIERRLRSLMASPEVAARARSLAGRLDARAARAAAAGAIEALALEHRGRGPF
jgi:rhamnosyltransferase subunit B